MWYLVLSRRKATPEEMGANIQGHLAWMQRQHQEANVLFSGPTTDRTTGIYVVRADASGSSERDDASDLRRGRG